MTILVLSALYFLNCLDADLFSVSLTLPMFLIVIYNLFMTQRKYVTVWEMSWLCAYIFFVLGPVQNLHDHIFADGSVSGFYFTTNELIRSMAIPIIFFFVLTYFSLREKQPLSIREYSVDQIIPAVWLAINVIVFMGIVLVSGSLNNLLASRLDRYDDDVNLLASILQPIQIATFLLITTHWFATKNDPYRTIIFLFAAVLIIIAQNPINTPRYVLLITYLPVGFIALSGKFRTSVFFPILILSAIIVMPIFNAISRMNASFLEALDSISVSELYKIPFLDVFDTLTYAVHWLDMRGYYWGGKALGIVFFFIPRSLWASKETLLGLDVGKDLMVSGMATIDNLSMFVGGDLYADLGFISVFLGAIVAGLMISRLRYPRTTLFLGHNLKSYLVIASMPILLRGPIGANASLLFMTIPCLHLLMLPATFREHRLHAGGESRVPQHSAPANPAIASPGLRLRSGPRGRTAP